MMKRMVCLCAVLVLCITALPVYAAGQGSFVVSRATGNPGDTVQITISTENNPGIVGLQLAVQYDKNVLELTKANAGVFNGVAFGPANKVPFNLNWVDAIHPDNKTNGVLATLTFKIKAGAPNGTYPITVSFKPENVFNLAWENVSFTTKAGGVTVGGAIPENGGTVATGAALHSVTEADDADRGLGFRFTLPAKGVKIKGDMADLSAATVSYKGADCKLVRMGALLSTKNDKIELYAAGVTDVVVDTMLDITATDCAYAVRLRNIPDSAVGTTVYARPYYVIEVGGKETVVYGTVDATTYQKNRT